VPRAPLPERLTTQALAGEPLRSAEQVAERLLAVQGQDPRGARLAVRARTSGVTAADVDRTIEKALTNDGPQTRPQLRERLDSAGVPTQGQALVHLLFLATLRGIAVRGPMAGKEQAYVLVRDWLGEPVR
jgi:hypothetical protein